MNADRNNRSDRFFLPRANILRGKSHFDRLFREGNRLSASNVDLRYLVFPDPTTGCLVAFVAGRKLGNAVIRNRCKRRMREAYRLQPPSFNGLYGFHGIFISKKPDVPFSLIQQDIRDLVERLEKVLPA